MSKRISDDDDVGKEKEAAADKISSGPSSNRELPYVAHKVGVPPKRSILKEFTAAVKETFFADQPLRSFKDQSNTRKFVLGIEALFPIIRWSRDYNLTKLRGDVIAGLTIASLCIPQDIGYAKLAGLPAENGLYSSFVPPLIYAFMGSSRDIAIGPVAVVSLLLGTMLQDEVNPKEDNGYEYRRLAFTATFFAGVTQITLGFFRLGFLIDFLSHAAIIGFMGGAAITIALQQLKGLLGIKVFTKKSDIVSVLRSVFSAAHHGWNWETILIGVSFLTFLIIAKYIGKVKNKKYFWVPAIAPLISVIVSTFFVFITRADKQGVAIVNHIRKGVNPPSANEIYFSGDLLAKGFKIGVVAGMIALTEAIAIGRTFAGMKDYQIDGNKEMVALGTMNIVGSMTSCYIATGSFSRSAVNYMSGCHTAVSNIVMSFVVFLTLKFITPLFKYTPNAILASIIISAVLGLIDINAMKLIWKIDKLDFVACMGAFFGVVFISVEIGLLIAVSISFAKILLQVTRPRTALLGRIPRTKVYRNVQQYPEAIQIPGVLIVRVDSAIYFSNSNYVKERILRWVTDEEAQLKQKCLPKINYLVVEMSPVIDIDTSGIHALEELYRSLQKRDIQLALANPGTLVIDKIHASEFPDLIGKDKIFLSVADAILTLASNNEI
ncbi:sulfate transporter 1.3-like [Rosa rugosa]|uniref:sulfate transporter 1.3-like n=1 Tax=Rosa rugosa TaxID=74645 RepID=UPI002B410C65|nr:sulfate transporter 1.3-like [Rosa rugosa]XP_062029276.1 sulfate transporter 1.3-like [Rosa rugosa]XP_062029277.1 sulfate transporter 1.3-like [Rosa rugosa]